MSYHWLLCAWYPRALIVHQHRLTNANNIESSESWFCWLTSSYGNCLPFGAPEFTTVFNGVCVTRSLVFCVMSRISLFVLLSPFFCALCCLSFFDSRILITPLISCGHCVVCPSSIHGFWLLLWYLVAIVLSVLLRFTDSDYSFDIFKLLLEKSNNLNISKSWLC
jgi:hypothetical protein